MNYRLGPERLMVSCLGYSLKTRENKKNKCVLHSFILTSTQC